MRACILEGAVGLIDRISPPKLWSSNCHYLSIKKRCVDMQGLRFAAVKEENLSDLLQDFQLHLPVVMPRLPVSSAAYCCANARETQPCLVSVGGASWETRVWKAGLCHSGTSVAIFFLAGVGSGAPCSSIVVPTTGGKASYQWLKIAREDGGIGFCVAQESLPWGHNRE